MNLDELALLYGTDKGSTGHWYTRFYERIFDPIRLSVESILEVGIGSGASLKMWKDFFPNAMIYGVDHSQYGDMGSRITIYQIEQTDCDGLKSNLADKKLEFIVDDAGHELERTMKTLECLFTILQPKGWYAIEDMDWKEFPRVIGQWIIDHHEMVKEFHLFGNGGYGRSGGACIGFIQKE